MRRKSLKYRASRKQRLGAQTWDMPVIHGLFRQALHRAVPLVEQADSKDAERINHVSNHVEKLMTQLLNHHQHEDDSLWLRLKQRIPEHTADIRRMELHHEMIKDDITLLRSLIHAWRDHPNEKDLLVETLHEFEHHVIMHLDDEERTIQPLAERYIKPIEWEAMRKRGLREIPPGERMVWLGELLQGAPTAEAREKLIQDLPVPVRLMYRAFGKKQFEKAWHDLYGPIL